MKEYKDSKYGRAKKKVEDIKGFYNHLAVYIVVNLAIIGVRVIVLNEDRIGFEIPEWTILSTPFFWGIGLFFHGLWVFSDKLSFIKSWEDRKIQEFMREDEEDENKMWQ